MNRVFDENSPQDTEDVYVHVGQQLRQLRMEHGMTQAQTAQIIAVSPQQYQKYEDAQSKCSLNNLMILANRFGTSLERFLPAGPESKQPPPRPAPVESEADLLARLVTAFVRLSDGDEKLRLVQLVEAIGLAKENREKVSKSDQ